MSKIKFRRARKALGIAMTAAMICTVAMPAFASGTTPNPGDPIQQGTGNGRTEGSEAWVGYETQDTRDEFLKNETKQTGATLTMHGAPGQHTFQAYQLLAGDISDTINGVKVGDNFDRVLANVRWGTGVDGDKLLANTEIKKIIGDNVKTARDFAEFLSKYENDDAELIQLMNLIGDPANGILTSTFTPMTQKSEDGTLETGVKTYTYEATGLNAGFYFVKDKDGSQTGDYANYSRYITKLVGDSTVNVKSETIKSEKKVKEDESFTADDGYGEGYNDTSDYEIGDTVPFEFVATLIEPSEMVKYKNDYHFIFHDEMSDGLTFNRNSVEIAIYEPKTVTIDGQEKVVPDFTKKVVDLVDVANGGQAYTVTQDATKPAQKFDIDILLYSQQNKRFAGGNKSNEGPTAQFKRGDLVVVRFTADLNKAAEIGMPGNPNKMTLEYSNNPNGDGTGETPEDEVVVFTYELDVDKIDGATADQENPTKLDDALFVFYRQDGDKKMYANLDADSKIDMDKAGTEHGWKEIATLNKPTQAQIDEWNQNWSSTGKAAFIKFYEDQGLTVIVTKKEQPFKIIGLDDESDYYLEEIKAPIGYNLLEEPIHVEIVAQTGTEGHRQDGNLKLTSLTRLFDKQSNFANAVSQNGDLDSGIVAGIIANNRGTVLPSTGGMGTTLFYTIGGVLLVGAAILLVTRKRVAEVH